MHLQLLRRIETKELGFAIDRLEDLFCAAVIFPSRPKSTNDFVAPRNLKLHKLSALAFVGFGQISKGMRKIERNRALRNAESAGNLLN